MPSRRVRQTRVRHRLYVVISADRGGLWEGLYAERSSREVGDAPSSRALGLALAKIASSSLASQTTCELQRRMRSKALHDASRAVAQGFLEYEISIVFRFVEPVTLRDATVAPTAMMRALAEQPGEFVKGAGLGSMSSAITARDAQAACVDSFGPLLPMSSVALAEPVATCIVSGQGGCLHCVALTGKVNRKRLLNSTDLPKKQLKRMRVGLPQQHQGAVVMAEKRWRGSQGVRDAELMLDWLEASMDLKQQRKAKLACAKFAKLLGTKIGIDATTLLDNTEFTSGRLLIKSRVRVDCAANLLHRKWWSSICHQEGLSVHIFCDAFPQWRGVELFATTIDIVVGGELFRRLAPLVSLSKAQLDQSGKLAAVLWQAFLMVGPTVESLSQFCGAVRSLTTDLGTERLLADSRHCLARFMQCLSAGVQEERPPQNMMLFAKCLHMPGFRHMVDNVIQRGLSSLVEFPSFLTKLKSIVKFLRNDLVAGEVCRCLRRDGCGALAEVIEKTSLVSFAAWRWGTLRDVCKSLSIFLSSLVERFDPKPFADNRDSAELKNVLAAFRSQRWRRLFVFVTWFTDKLTALMDWVGGCPCHETNDSFGAVVECERKGRRLPEVHDKVMQVLSHMLEEAEGWTPAFFDGDITLWQECQGCVRFVDVHAREKAAFLNKFPYLFAKLPQAHRWV